jgi:adenylate cyclase
MNADRAQRRLAAIMTADISGYSRLIGADEEGTLGRIRSIRAEVVDPKIAAHHGRLVKTTGDGLLVEFASVIDALCCATEVQHLLAARNATSAMTERIEFRIGINVGDVVVEDGDIFGDGVNVAARLEALAEPGGICVSARVQEDAAGRLDLMFVNMGEKNLKNIARPVRVYRVVTATGEVNHRADRIESEPALALPDKPSIAVLPFANMSGDPEQEYFADGMVEEIITALSRIRWLFVIARNSSFVYKGQTIDVKRVGRELGVRYLLQGSVRKDGGRVRIAAQLVDAEAGAHLWADHFDGSLQDVFELQDRVAISAAGVIEPALQAAEARRSAHRPTNDLTAYDLYLHALPNIVGGGRESVREALGLLEQAVARDPHYGPALSLAAMCITQLHLGGWAETPDVGREQAIDYARRAVRAAGNDPFVLASAAAVFGFFGEDITAALALVDRALAANPGFAYGWFWSGMLRMYAGQYDIAIEQVEKSLRLNPLDRIGAPLTAIAGAHFFKREFEVALAKVQASIQERPDFPMSYRLLAACYAHMGRLAEARAAIERLRALTPAVAPLLLPIRNPEDRELLLSGLRLAVGEPA